MKNNRKRLIIVGSVLLLVVIAVVLCFYQCKKRTFTINIRIPAGAEEGYYYTDEDISCYGSTLKMVPTDSYTQLSYRVYPADDFYTTDGVVVGNIKGMDPVSTGNKVTYKVKKKEWYKVGVYTSNNTDQDMVIPITIHNISVRISCY